jgi:multidrug efflux system outer membrane protein
LRGSLTAIPTTRHKRWFRLLSIPGVNGGCAITVFGLMLLLTGCAVGPDYQAPQPALPANFSEPGGTPPSTNSMMVPVDDWWTVLQDPTLNELMQEAARSAPDLAMADARIREARALRTIAASDQYPTLDAGGAYNRTHGSENVPLGVPPGGLGPGEDGNIWQAGFDASWEIDIFGGLRRKTESANASYQGEIASRRDVALTLYAEIARNYAELRSVQRQLVIIKDELADQSTLLSLTQSRFNAGLSSRQEVASDQAGVSAVEAQIPTLVTEEHAAIYRIAVLIGRNPEELLGKLTAPVSVSEMAPPDVPVGLPSDLLRRRPDISVAERTLAAANARIGVAKADLYPHFYLTGLAGLESLNFNTFINAASGYYAVGPGITWKVFDADKIRSEVLAERARTDQAAVAYQLTVLNALKEVETALVSYAQAEIRHHSLTNEVAADRTTLALSSQLYDRGVEDYYTVLDARENLEAAEYELAGSERDTLVSLIALYKSLGGGWQDNSRQNPAPMANLNDGAMATETNKSNALNHETRSIF